MPAIGEDDFPARHQLAALRAERYAQFVCPFRQERAARLAFEDISQAVCTAVGHRKRRDREIVRFEERPRLDLVHPDRHGRLVAAQDHTVDQVMDPVEGGAAAEDIQLLDRLPAHECGHQTGQPEDMVEVTMRQQDAGQVLEPGTRLQDLALGALPTIHQKSIFIMFDDLGRESPLGRRRGSGCAEEEYFKQS